MIHYRIDGYGITGIQARTVSEEEKTQIIKEQARRTVTYPSIYDPVTGAVDIEAAAKIEQATGVSVPAERYPEPQHETRVVGAFRVGTRAVEQPAVVVSGPTEPTWRETTATGWLYAREPTGIGAGFVGKFESYIRPEVPTALGAGFEFLTVRGYPTYHAIPEYMGVPKATHTPYTLPPRDPFGELKELGPGYIVGSVLGEAAEIYLWYKIAGKVFTKKEKVVTRQYELMPKEVPFKTQYATQYFEPMKEPSKLGITFKAPMSKKGVQVWFGYGQKAVGEVAEEAWKPSYQNIVSNLEKNIRSIVGGKMQPFVAQVVRTAPEVTMKPSVSTLAAAVTTVTKPSALRYAGPLVSMFLRGAVKIREEPQPVYYTKPGEVQRLEPKTEQIRTPVLTSDFTVRDIAKQYTELVKDQGLRPVLPSGMKPFITGDVKEMLRPTISQVTREDYVEDTILRQETQAKQIESQMQRLGFPSSYRVLPRGPTTMPRPAFEVPKYRERAARRGVKVGYYMRIWPIAEPEQVMRRALGFRSTKRKRRR